MRRTIVTVASLLVSIAPCVAQTGQQTAQPAPTIVSGRAGEPLICHTYTHEGFLVSRAICRTAQQWTRVRLQEQAEVTQFQLHSLVNMGR
jgi:hypothetical protein